MKIMKKSFLIFLVLLFLTTNNLYALEFNAYNHIYKHRDASLLSKLSDNLIEFDEIDDLISLYNPTMKNNWNNYEANKTNSDIYNDYIDAYNNLDGLANSADSDVQAAMYRAQADAMLINADNNVLDSDVNFLNYYLVEKNLILSTKTLFINYYKYLVERDIAEANLKETERQFDTAKNNYELGNLTKVEYLAALKAVDDAKANVIISKSNIDTTRRNLLINCGKEILDSVSLANVKKIEQSDIAKINLYEDMQKAVDNNIQYEIYKRQLQNARTDEMKKQNEIKYVAATNYIRADVETKYDEIKDALTMYNNSTANKDYTKSELVKAEREYSNGNISQKEYKTAIYNRDIAIYNEEKAYYDLLIAYENYKAVVNGIASAGN